jgi:cobalamin synthase
MERVSSEIIISIVFLILLLLFVNPFMFWMPDAFLYMLIVGLIVVFGLFAGLVWHEHASDEREQLHRMIASRAGYIAGVTLLVVAISYQSITLGRADAWLVATVSIMILAKLAGRLYGKIKT